MNKKILSMFIGICLLLSISFANANINSSCGVNGEVNEFTLDKDTSYSCNSSIFKDPNMNEFVINGNGNKLIVSSSLFDYFPSVLKLEDVELDCNGFHSLNNNVLKGSTSLIIENSKLIDCGLVGGKVKEIIIDKSVFEGNSRLLQDNNGINDNSLFSESEFKVEDSVFNLDQNEVTLFQFFKLNHSLVKIENVTINIGDDVEDYTIFFQGIGGHADDVIIEDIYIDNFMSRRFSGAPFLLTQFSADSFLMSDVEVNTRSRSDSSLWMGFQDYSNLHIENVTEDVFVLFLGNKQKDGDGKYTFKRTFSNNVEIEFDYYEGTQMQTFINPAMSEPNFIVDENKFEFNKYSSSYSVPVNDDSVIDLSRKPVKLTFFNEEDREYELTSSDEEVVKKGKSDSKGKVSFNLIPTLRKYYFKVLDVIESVLVPEEDIILDEEVIVNDSQNNKTVIVDDIIETNSSELDNNSIVVIVDNLSDSNINNSSLLNNTVEDFDNSTFNESEEVITIINETDSNKTIIIEVNESEINNETIVDENITSEINDVDLNQSEDNSSLENTTIEDLTEEVNVSESFGDESNSDLLNNTSDNSSDKEDIHTEELDEVVIDDDISNEESVDESQQDNTDDSSESESDMSSDNQEVNTDSADNLISEEEVDLSSDFEEVELEGNQTV